jgi:hypothetical protein
MDSDPRSADQIKDDLKEAVPEIKSAAPTREEAMAALRRNNREIVFTMGAVFGSLYLKHVLVRTIAKTIHHEMRRYPYS